ncbi:MAG: alkene reductase, partial [Xanthobacteraceae bacterium]
PAALFAHVLDVLDAIAPVYVHIIEGATGGPRDIVPGFDFEALHRRFRGTWMVNNGYTGRTAQQAIAAGAADLVAFGHDYVSNPDLVERLKRDAAFAPLNRETLYGGGANGYTDYPALEPAAA